MLTLTTRRQLERPMRHKTKNRQSNRYWAMRNFQADTFQDTSTTSTKTRFTGKAIPPKSGSKTTSTQQVSTERREKI